MTFTELYDSVSFTAGDSSSQFKTAERTWMNLVRSDIADRALWRFAIRVDATITTDAATTDGLYDLTGYEFIYGDRLYDQTNRQNINHESYGTTQQIDQAKETFGPPAYWADAGSDGSGERQVYLWPIPSGTFTITYPGYKRLTDITAANDGETEDQFFGPITPWAACFIAGLKYFYRMDDDQDANDFLLADRKYEKSIARRLASNRVSRTAPVPGKIVNNRVVGATMGRFSPAHFNNRAG